MDKIRFQGYYNNKFMERFHTQEQPPEPEQDQGGSSEQGQTPKGSSRRNFLKGLMAMGSLVLSQEAAGEQREDVSEHIEYSETSQDGAEAHKSGNIFADKVGKTLQENLKNGNPSKVTNPRVEIFVTDNITTGITEFKFRWSCDIRPCEPKDADSHFDRRGTLLSGKTEEEALRKIENELKSSQKVQKMMDGFDKAYGEHKMPNSFVSMSVCFHGGTCWAAREFFCTAN